MNLQKMIGFYFFFLLVGCEETSFKSSGNPAKRNSGPDTPGAQSSGPLPSNAADQGTSPTAAGVDQALPPGPIDCTNADSKIGLKKINGDLNFENSEGTDGMTVDAAKNDHFLNVYGVSLNAVSRGDLKFVKIAQAGGPESSFKAWGSIMCSGRPSYNRLCDTESQVTGGQFALSTSQSMKTKQIEFEIRYKLPVQELSFDLIDVDGGENWSVQPSDANGVAVGAPVTLESLGYTVGVSTNSKTRRFTVTSPTQTIFKVNLKATKTGSNIGFGFDNFKTGLTYCP